MKAKNRELQVIPDECTLVSQLEFKKTPNPSSIIWENRAAVDRNMQTKRSKKIIFLLFSYEVLCCLIIYAFS